MIYAALAALAAGGLLSAFAIAPLAARRAGRSGALATALTAAVCVWLLAWFIAGLLAEGRDYGPLPAMVGAAGLILACGTALATARAELVIAGVAGGAAAPLAMPTVSEPAWAVVAVSLALFGAFAWAGARLSQRR
jgi:hypothetical protein